MAKPKKKWGQNFLRNRPAADRIVAAVEAAPGETILEIGPGEGVLTEKLLALGAPVTAIEIDPELASDLRGRFGAKLELIEGDAVETSLPDSPYRAVGNLPYNVGTPILRRVIADSRCRRAVFMLQKEVADRVTAGPGDDAYGYLTLYCRLFADARRIMTLEPKSFHPPPKVRSAVVVLDPVARSLLCDRAPLLALISIAFRMRRKKLVNNLTGWNGQTKDSIAAAMSRAGIDAGVRAETLSLEQFDRLCKELEEGGRGEGEG